MSTPSVKAPEDWNGLDPALQNVIIAGLALIIAHLPSRDWDIPG
jgi:hypothetical protein